MQASIEQPAGFSVVTGPNRSLSATGKVLVILSIAGLTLGIAGAFAFLGLWWILPFAGIEVLGVSAAFLWLARHEHDFERLSIDGDRVLLERRDGSRREKVELNRHWARVVLGCRSGDRGCRLALRSHGIEYEFGRHLSDDDRVVLAKELHRVMGH
jgi:uncharacterized membrane protein